MERSAAPWVTVAGARATLLAGFESMLGLSVAVTVFVITVPVGVPPFVVTVRWKTAELPGPRGVVLVQPKVEPEPQVQPPGAVTLPKVVLGSIVSVIVGFWAWLGPGFVIVIV